MSKNGKVSEEFKINPPVQISRVPVPDVYKECSDVKNILIKLQTWNILFLGNRTQILPIKHKKWHLEAIAYTRSQFTVCKTNLLHINEITFKKEMALRSI